MLKQWLTCLLLMCFCCVANAQQGNAEAALLRLTMHSDSLTANNGAEKIYIQFDKPYYVVTDTIWLKAYLFNAPSHQLSARSGLLHIDIANDSNKIVKQYLLPVFNGLCWGNIGLDGKFFRSGDYTLRAYTNWMRNFGDDGFFYKQIHIAGINENGWLVNSKISKEADGTNVKTQLRITAMDKHPLADSVVQVELTDGRKVLSKQNLQTDKNGLLYLNFSPQSNTGKLNVVLQNKNRTKKVLVPVTLNRPENTDIQFMPEGGSLVAGLPARVGFKAIGEDRKSVAVSGDVVDHRDSVVASFKTLYNGMGSYYMQPQVGENYRAKVSLPGGSVKYYSLPAVKPSGTLLRIKTLSGNDSLEVIVAATNDLANRSYYLIGNARGLTCYAALADLGKAPFMRSRVAKSKFPEGITHFILMTTAGQPLNERLVYIERRDSLRISIATPQTTYNVKDSIALQVNVADNAGKPVTGNFSMAVTDDSQVHGDSLDNDNIVTRMLLTSDLKGYVEQPGYYFRDNDTARQALDNLLLTQGWVNYEAKFDMPFKTEKEFTVQGVVNNLFRSPVKKTHVVLFSRSPAILFDTVTNNKGRFVFDRFPRIDTPVFFLKAVNHSGKSFNVNIDVDEQDTPQFNATVYPMTMPWYVNTDTTLMNYVKNTAWMKEAAVPGGGRLLKEVQIKAKKTVKGSYNLNGAGNADIVLDEKDLEAAGKKNWLQLLQENIKGFREGGFCLGCPATSEKCTKDFILLSFVTDNDNLGPLNPEGSWYFIHDKPVKFIIDGVPLYVVLPLAAKEVPFFNITNYLKLHNAEDIKGFEINTSTKNTYRYVPMKWSGAVQPNDVAFVEITTRSGSGPGIKNTPGVYLYKPLAISWPKQFYKPKYTFKDTANLADLRSTIDWEPNVRTDKNGEATVWFYAAGTPSSYSIIIEGVDGDGLLGYKRQKLLIAKPKSAAGK